MNPTYITATEAKTINTALASLTDPVINNLIYISEEIIDQYVGVPTTNPRVFPIDTPTVPEDVKYVCAMLCSTVLQLQTIGDPTMGGVITKESALDRSVEYSGKTQRSVDAIPPMLAIILDKYKFSGGGDISWYSLIQHSTNAYTTIGNNNTKYF